MYLNELKEKEIFMINNYPAEVHKSSVSGFSVLIAKSVMHKLSTGVVLKTCTPGTPSPHSLT
jgi:hypothetical protein